MHSVESAVELLVIAYPLVFVIMALFAGLTMLLVRLFPVKG